MLIPFLCFISFPIWKIPVGKFLTPRGIETNREFKNRNESSKDFAMDHIKILQNEEGRKTAVIRAEKAVTGNNVNEFHLQRVDADFWDKKDNVVKIVAETGSYDVASEVLTLKNDVVITRVAEKQKMYTDHLVYSGKERTVASPGTTRFVGENFDVVGGRLDYDLNSGLYRLSKRVRCVIGGVIGH